MISFITSSINYEFSSWNYVLFSFSFHFHIVTKLEQTTNNNDHPIDFKQVKNGQNYKRFYTKNNNNNKTKPIWIDNKNRINLKIFKNDSSAGQHKSYWKCRTSEKWKPLLKFQNLQITDVLKRLQQFKEPFFLQTEVEHF